MRALIGVGWVPVLLGTTLILGALAGCVDSTGVPDERLSGEGHATFEGPFAPQFESAWAEATTTLQRKILADGEITARENSEVQDSFVECMAASQVKVSWSEGGGFSLAPLGSSMDPEEANEPVSKCERESTGPISWLYYEVRSNPENQDIFELMAKCLEGAGVVERGYSAADYKREFEADAFRFDETDESFRQCNLDPTGAGSKGSASHLEN
ncbi:hypothetical protein [Frondihabitans sp. VKM Ac-2883]|uniref:hypothetical protein n=1 Tax=Frondihabitans sp. VKM Ac-2883 TaxID=2783823 RepID=UPI00188C0582|nr:hypothetical protein [Frondihabitans sp. VKM Ac-2883]MBF4575334.1 hypothetical protein [Frondihabitans sp. VKM Ac-2883]